jgi:hypothetical protein
MPSKSSYEHLDKKKLYFVLISKFFPTNLGALSDEEEYTNVSGAPSSFADI